MEKIPVIFNQGMGVESTSIFLRWIFEPESRDFDLDQLIVISAQTGDEFSDTKALMEAHILPLMRLHGIRYVQAARAGHSEKDGVTILSDTHQPDCVYIEGDYALSSELTESATLPTYGLNRKCSQKFKGFVLDWVVGSYLGLAGKPYRQIMGFNADETKRVAKDCSYTQLDHQHEYPLVEWGWGREQCEAYIFQCLGVHWAKSCCKFCPFAGGKEAILSRYRQFPEDAAFALFMEHVSVSANPRMTLYSGKSLHATLVKDGNFAALEAYRQMLETSEWGVYRVRRVYKKKGHAVRDLTLLAQAATQAEAEVILASVTVVAIEREERQPPVTNYSLPPVVIPRAYTIRRVENSYPAMEEMFVVMPAVAASKRRNSFDNTWQRTIQPQLELALVG